MNAENKAEDMVGSLVSQLASNDAVAREKARLELIRLGGARATRELVLTLMDPQPHVRWEAAKALQGIADPVAAPALLIALDDDDENIRWVAAEALVALQSIGLRAVLSGLTKRAGSVDFCKAAHHVLHEVQGYAQVVAPVLRALEQSDSAVAAPPAAYQALVSLNDVKS